VKTSVWFPNFPSKQSHAISCPPFRVSECELIVMLLSFLLLIGRWRWGRIFPSFSFSWSRSSFSVSWGDPIRPARLVILPMRQAAPVRTPPFSALVEQSSHLVFRFD